MLGSVEGVRGSGSLVSSSMSEHAVLGSKTSFIAADR